MPRTVSDGGDDADIGSRTSSHRHTDSTHAQHGYKVGIPPTKNVLTEFFDAIKETFFADDPLRRNKDQPKSKKIWLGLQQVFPVLDWGRSYNLGKFKGDVIAGLTIASLAGSCESRASSYPEAPCGKIHRTHWRRQDIPDGWRRSEEIRSKGSG